MAVQIMYARSSTKIHYFFLIRENMAVIQSAVLFLIGWIPVNYLNFIWIELCRWCCLQEINYGLLLFFFLDHNFLIKK